ncbi:MAG: CoA transferase [Xanthobacteraceae bacterium]|nr:CoA transferase [Xanthobacteraceae bacterium]
MSTLQGIKVVEATTMITGPLAGMLLADLGADVVKLENPNGGDPFRTFRGKDHSPHFLSYNRNKKSLALDIRSEQGKDVLLNLIRRADVFIENFRPGVMDRLGVGRAVLMKENPRLVYCAITGFGSTGPYKDRPAYDAVAQALAGTSSLFFHGDPVITGPSLSDNLTGMYACYGILAALVERGRTGRGRAVDVSMIEATMAFMPDPFLAHTMLGLPAEPLMRARASQSYALRCSDGKLVSIHMSSQEKFWLAMLETFAVQKLADDPRFSSRAGRVDNYLELAQELQKAAATAPRDHWLKRLEANDVPHAPVNSLPEVMADPQVRHLGSFHEMHHPDRGTYQAIRRPVYFDGSRDDQPLDLPPSLNADGERILRDLGYDDAAIDNWRSHNDKLISGAGK